MFCDSWCDRGGPSACSVTVGVTKQAQVDVLFKLVESLRVGQLAVPACIILA
jgi:hypothetical protein